MFPSHLRQATIMSKVGGGWRSCARARRGESASLRITRRLIPFVCNAALKVLRGEIKERQKNSEKY